MPFRKATLNPREDLLMSLHPEHPSHAFMSRTSVAHAARMRQERRFFAGSTKPPPAHHSSQCYELYRKKTEGPGMFSALQSWPQSSPWPQPGPSIQPRLAGMGRWGGRCRQDQHVPDTARKVALLQVREALAAAPKKTGPQAAASSARAGNRACVLRANPADIKPSPSSRGAL